MRLISPDRMIGLSTTFVVLAALFWGLSGGIGSILTGQGWDPIVVSFFRGAIAMVMLGIVLLTGIYDIGAGDVTMIAAAAGLAGRCRSDRGSADNAELATVHGTGGVWRRIVIHFIYRGPEPYRIGRGINCCNGRTGHRVAIWRCDVERKPGRSSDLGHGTDFAHSYRAEHTFERSTSRCRLDYSLTASAITSRWPDYADAAGIEPSQRDHVRAMLRLEML